MQEAAVTRLWGCEWHHLRVFRSHGPDQADHKDAHHTGAHQGPDETAKCASPPSHPAFQSRSRCVVAACLLCSCADDGSVLQRLAKATGVTGCHLVSGGDWGCDWHRLRVFRSQDPDQAAHKGDHHTGAQQGPDETA